MSDTRLLIDIEVLEFLRTLRRREQADLLSRFRDIAVFPSNYSDFVEYDSSLVGELMFTSSGHSPSNFGTISLTVT